MTIFFKVLDFKTTYQVRFYVYDTHDYFCVAKFYTSKMPAALWLQKDKDLIEYFCVNSEWFKEQKDFKLLPFELAY